MSSAAVPGTHSPRTVVVVGAGVVGLSCAWHLQEHGLAVTVVDRAGVAAGASHGNAGYISPGLAVPLPEPAVLRYGLRAVLDPRSPVRFPGRPSRATVRFLVDFVRHATQARWRAGLRALGPLNRGSHEAYDELVTGGVTETRRRQPILAVFDRPASAGGLLAEVAEVIATGQPFPVELLSGTEVRRLEPALDRRISFALAIAEPTVDPPTFVSALAASVRERGGEIREQTPVRAVRPARGGAIEIDTDRERLRADAVVLAAGAWLPALAGAHGVRMPMHAGRGYSFVVDADPAPRHPIYVPMARSATTPVPSGIRMTGLMDLDGPDDPLRPRRVRVIHKAVARTLVGADWSSRRAEWVGPRPLTADGLPLIGPTRTPGVYVAGGHGMWGLTHGPITGRLLSGWVARGVAPPELRPFDPCR